MCFLHLTHPRAHTHTPGAADTHTHTHTHTWSSQRCGARGAVGGSVPCSRVSLQSWTIPAGAENPQPQITSPALYPLGHDCTSIITYSYTVLLHIQCGSVKSNAILIKIHKHIKSYSIASEIPSNVRFFSEIWMNEIPWFIIIILQIYFLRSQYSQMVLLCASAVIM